MTDTTGVDVQLSNEPTLDEVRDAVLQLPIDVLRALAKGPMDDPEACRVCDDALADFVFCGPVTPYSDACGLLIDWHKWHGDPEYHAGRGGEAYRRCQVIYELAAERVAAQEEAIAWGGTREVLLAVEFDGLPEDEVEARADAMAAQLARWDGAERVSRARLAVSRGVPRLERSSSRPVPAPLGDPAGEEGEGVLAAPAAGEPASSLGPDAKSTSSPEWERVEPSELQAGDEISLDVFGREGYERERRAVVARDEAGKWIDLAEGGRVYRVQIDADLARRRVDRRVRAAE